MQGMDNKRIAKELLQHIQLGRRNLGKPLNHASSKT